MKQYSQLPNKHSHTDVTLLKYQSEKPMALYIEACSFHFCVEDVVYLEGMSLFIFTHIILPIHFSNPPDPDITTGNGNDGTAGLHAINGA